MEIPQTLNYWILQSVAMGVTALLIPKLRITGIVGAVGTVVALAFINATVWDAALFFSVPDSFSYKAMSLFFANGFLFWVLVKVLPGIEVDGFLAAFIAPVVFTFCSLFISEYGKDIDWNKVIEQVVEVVKTSRDSFVSDEPTGNVVPRASTTPAQ